MATFTDIYKQELKNKGVISSLGSAAIKRVGEKIDPRNILFGGKGIFSATGQKLFGKGYSGISKAPSASKISMGGSELSAPILNEILISSKTQEAQLKIVAKNTMNNNAMARDINVMRQNIMKLVTMGGGKASRGADMFFKDAGAREKSYESQFGKERIKALPTTPTPVQKTDEGGGIFSAIFSLGNILKTAIVSSLGKIPTLLSELLSVDKLFKVLGLGTNILTFIGRAFTLLSSGPFLGILAAVVGSAWLINFLKERDAEANTEDKIKKRIEDYSGSQAAKMATENLPVRDAKDYLKNLSDKEILDETGYTRAELQQKIDEAVKNKQATIKRPELRKRLDVSEDNNASQNDRELRRTQTVAPTPVSSLEATVGATPVSIKATRISDVEGLPIDYKSYADKIGQRESKNKYNAVNSLGYLGKYQFGAAALEDMGLVKTGVGKKGQKALDYSENWNIAGGKEAFLNNPDLQEETMKKYTLRNFKSLRRLGVISDESSPDQIAGFLATSHLLGPGGAKKMKEGISGKDAYGTTGESYYKLGSATQIQPAPTTGSTLASVSKETADLTRVSASAASAAPVVIDNSTKNVTTGGAPMQVSSASAFNNDWFDLSVSRVTSFSNVG